MRVVSDCSAESEKRCLLYHDRIKSSCLSTCHTTRDVCARKDNGVRDMTSYTYRDQGI